MAHNLFSKADKDMVITITLDDLKVFEYRENNASLWVESTELEVEIFDKVTKKILSTPEAEQRGVQTFCVRTVIQPDSHATALMWLGLVPMDINNLKSKLPEEYKKTCCPQIALAMGAGGARAKRILMSVREKEHEGFGFGCFPILEALYPGETTLPAVSDLKEALYRFMRATKGNNNRSGSTILQTIDNPDEALKETPPQFSWPQLRDNTPVLGDEGRK